MGWLRTLSRSIGKDPLDIVTLGFGSQHLVHTQSGRVLNFHPNSRDGDGGIVVPRIRGCHDGCSCPSARGDSSYSMSSIIERYLKIRRSATVAKGLLDLSELAHAIPWTADEIYETCRELHGSDVSDCRRISGSGTNHGTGCYGEQICDRVRALVCQLYTQVVEIHRHVHQSDSQLAQLDRETRLVGRVDPRSPDGRLDLSRVRDRANGIAQALGELRDQDTLDSLTKLQSRSS